MWIYGKRAVTEAIKSRRRIDRILLQEGGHLPHELLSLIKAHNIAFQIVSKLTLNRMFKDKKHQGIAAFISPIEYRDAEFVIDLAFEESGAILALDHLEDPQNLGNIMRSSETFPVSGIVIPSRRSAPISDAVVKASGGAVFYLNITRVSSLGSFLNNFQKRGGWVYALHMDGEAINEMDFQFPLALIVGSEGHGISKPLLNIADFRVSIPMGGKIESLNVASATAIALFWLYLRRGIKDA